MKNLTISHIALIMSLAITGGSLPAQEIPPRALLNMKQKDSAARLIPSTNQVKVMPDTLSETPGMIVTIAPGEDPWPGVKLLPEGENSWNLSQWGHIESKVTNLGKTPLRINMRVDGPGNSQDRPWNSEGLTIPPGKSSDLKVIFGHSGGFNPGYPLKPDSVLRVLLFTGKSAEEQSFRVESIAAAGPPGEKHVNMINAQRIKPEGGVIFGKEVRMDVARQITTAGGASAQMERDALVLSFPQQGAKESARIKPAVGRWHLGDANEVRVTIRNIGNTSVTPTVEIFSEQVNGIKSTGKTIAPGAVEVMKIPFAAAVRWQGVSAAERKGSHDSKPGTGTLYASDKTDGIVISAEHTGAARIQIDSIIAAVSTADVPEWVGQKPPVEGDWVKVFEDNFDSPTIDNSKWNIKGPNHWDSVSHWSPGNVILGDGTLKMRVEKKTGFQNDNPKEKQTDIQSAYLDTYEKFSQKYGYYEARMKLPTAPGLWPAFWMMPDRGPNSGDAPGSRKLRMTTRNNGMEFDILEGLSIWGPHRYNIALHWDDYDKDHKAIGTGKIYTQPDKDGFITSGLLWLPGQAVFYCNGKEVGRWEDPRVSTVPAYIIFTMPMGGWDGNVANVEGKGLPDHFVIDYVRVWQLRQFMDQPAH